MKINCLKCSSLLYNNIFKNKSYENYTCDKCKINYYINHSTDNAAMSISFNKSEIVRHQYSYVVLHDTVYKVDLTKYDTFNSLYSFYLKFCENLEFI